MPRRTRYYRHNVLPTHSMKRHVLIFGAVGGTIVTLLQWMQYRFLVVEHSVEIYAALIAAIFAGVGIWLGIRLTRSHQTVVIEQAPPPLPLPPAAPRRRDDLGLTPRELEILALVAKGLSNREIAEQLFVSENTVKTHCSRAFEKLGARRRTQAVQLGKEFGLLP